MEPAPILVRGNHPTPGSSIGWILLFLWSPINFRYPSTSKVVGTYPWFCLFFYWFSWPLGGSKSVPKPWVSTCIAWLFIEHLERREPPSSPDGSTEPSISMLVVSKKSIVKKLKQSVLDYFSSTSQTFLKLLNGIALGLSPWGVDPKKHEKNLGENQRHLINKYLWDMSRLLDT